MFSISLTQPLIKSNFAEHIFITHHTFTDIETNLEILHTLPKGPKLNTAEQYEIYKHYKQSPTNILNDQIHYKSHTLFDTIKHSSHNNISAIPTTTNRNIAASSTASSQNTNIGIGSHFFNLWIVKTRMKEAQIRSFYCICIVYSDS